MNQYDYDYSSACMIEAITRNSETVDFGYDKTYQLTSEAGAYITNFAGGSPSPATVSNDFAYDAAGNHANFECRVSTVECQTRYTHGDGVCSYRHTIDNQLTGIYWDSSKVTLGGEIQQAWTTEYVKVKQTTASNWTMAEFQCQRGKSPFVKGGEGGFVRWTAREVPVTGSGQVQFQVQCHTPDGQTVNETVTYSKTSTGAGNIKYQYDNRGNRTKKWTNGFFAARYFYDIDNQLVGISFDDDSNHTDQGDYTYTYDPFGRRIAAKEDGQWRYFIHDGLDVIAELDNSGDLKKYYTRGSGLGGGIGDIVASLTFGTSPSTNYYSYNHRGDVVLLTTEAGEVTTEYEYDAFGQLTANCLPLTADRFIAFSSKEYDKKSGLSYYGYRFYDSESGTWINKDPMNVFHEAYVFVGNHPLDSVDPSGLHEHGVRQHYITPGLITFEWWVLQDQKCDLQVSVTFDEDWFGHVSSLMLGASTQLSFSQVYRRAKDCSNKCGQGEKGKRWDARYKVSYSKSINMPATAVTLASAGAGMAATAAVRSFGRLAWGLARDTGLGYLAGHLPGNVRVGGNSFYVQIHSGCCCYCDCE